MHSIIRSLALPAFAVAAFGQPARAPEPPLPREPLPQQQQIQQRYGPVGLALVTPNIDPSLIDRFKTRFGAQGKEPRLLLYVNRPLYETEDAKAEDVTPAADAARTSAKAAEPQEPTLADRQTVREIEFLVGGVIRAFGGDLVDPAAALGAPTGRLTGESVDQQREKLSKVADIAVEVLASSRRQKIVAVSGDREITVPDIQMTAIRLSDSAIVGQANAASILNGLDPGVLAAVAADVRSLTEATAQHLVLDMIDALQQPPDAE